MKRHYVSLWLGFIFLALPLLSVGNVQSQGSESPPTPTYDPLVEPVVPENPSEYDLGRNWYWHYCMPCHGDKGQGLTDEWRAVWEPDHQDCWGYGCHTGERIQDSFAIPTVVPPVVSNAKLARFSSLESLHEFLMRTHPPQSPGWLKDEQYRAIALYIFHENDRSLVEATLSSTSAPKPTHTPLQGVAIKQEASLRPNIFPYLGLGVILVAAIIWGVRKLR